MKSRHIPLCRPFCPIHLHSLPASTGELLSFDSLPVLLPVPAVDYLVVDRSAPVVIYALVDVVAETIVDDEVMGHTDPMWFHRVTEVVDVVSDIGVVEVGNAAGIGGSGGWGRRHRRHGAGHGVCMFVMIGQGCESDIRGEFRANGKSGKSGISVELGVTNVQPHSQLLRVSGKASPMISVTELELRWKTCP